MKVRMSLPEGAAFQGAVKGRAAAECLALMARMMLLVLTPALAPSAPGTAGQVHGFLNLTCVTDCSVQAVKDCAAALAAALHAQPGEPFIANGAA